MNTEELHPVETPLALDLPVAVETAPASPEVPETPEATEVHAEAAQAAANAEAAEPAVAAETAVVAEPPVAPAEPTPEQLAARKAAEEGRKRAAETWQRVASAKDSGETLNGRIKSEIKGGLLADVEGYRAFLPASQTRVAKGTPLATLVNQTVPLKVIEVDEKRKRLVVSHRRALEEERRVSRAALLQSLHVGEERSAKVVRMADFGAFVDLGGVDALVPIGELAFERVDKPTDVVNVGDEFAVRIMRIDQGGKKISASRKAALADPWRDHAELLRSGNVVEGTVIAKEPRLEVEIAPGVIGSLSDREANPDEYEIGEKVEVSVRNVDYRNRRIRLSTMHAAVATSSSGFAPLGVELKRS
ncbi:MAG: S1 RNA-binding domain-containing protein [bacterium]|nr:S1 RNA-binding domain-containing protein [bacterium]